MTGRKDTPQQGTAVDGARPEPSAADGPPPRTGRKIRPRLEIIDTSGEPRSEREPPVRTVLLVESDPQLRAKVRESLPSGYELVTAQAGEAGLRAARLCGPDLILFDPATGGKDTLSQLQADPLTSAIPIIPLLGADAEDPQLGHPALLEPVARPVNVVELRGRIAAAVEGPVPGETPRVLRGDLGGATVSEVVEFVQNEIRRWVLDAAGPDVAEEKVELGQSGQLMGALWAFIARFRDVISKGSEGRISFQDHGQRERISMLTLSAAGGEVEVGESDVVSAVMTAEGIERLRGLRALVADDDPKVRWAFATLLREVGMEVDTVADGAEALVAAGQARPDVVITDILMPGMDGWELLRRLRRDLLLRDVPVVVLSWKEDFLQRMRELDADADEYMRKELDRDQVLLRLAGVVAARRQMEDRLVEGDEVAGRVEATGIVPVLRAMARCRGDSRLVVRDTSNVYEADYHAGQLVRVATTSEHDRRVSGSPALSCLLGVSRGRFVVSERTEEIETNLDGDLDEVLHRAAAPVQQMIEQVTDGAIVRVAKLELRPEEIDEYLELAPQEARYVIERLQQGEPPRELILASVCGPQELERIVLDLIKRGAVARIDAPLPSAASLSGHADETRWAAIGGAAPAARSEASGPPGRPAVSSSLPPTPEHLDGARPLPPDQSSPIRSWIAFVLIVAAALVLGYLIGHAGS